MTPEAKLRAKVPMESSSLGTATVRSRNLESQAEQAIASSRDYLLSTQTQDGYWWSELEADTTLESDYVLYLHILGQLKSPKVAKLANYIRKKQLADGGWNIFEGGPSELNATIKAYMALRLAGQPASHPDLVRAKDKVIELGGIEGTNSYVRFYLAMVGAMIELSRTLNFRVVAEHVEDQLSLDTVREMGIDRKSTRLNSSHSRRSRMPSSA